MDVIFDNLDRFADGLWVTVQLTLLSFAFAFASASSSRVSASAGPAAARRGRVHVETVRNTPLLSC